MAARKRKSLREIARICGVSPATVSRISNGTGSFSPETKALVIDALKREGYDVGGLEAPEPARLVGVIVATYESEFFSALLSDIDRFCAANNAFSVVCEGRSSAGREKACLEQLYRMGAAGIFIISPRDQSIMDALRPEVPTVLVDAPFGSEDERVASIRSDQFVGGQLAARELIQKGCTRPIVLNNRGLDIDKNERINGFVHEFARAGINVPADSIQRMDVDRPSFSAAKDLVSYLWTKGHDFDSVFACNDWRAYGALVALRNLGVKVPEQVKVIGYDGIRVSKFCDTPITTIKQDTIALSSFACEMLFDLMAGNEPLERHALVPVQLQEGFTS